MVLKEILLTALRHIKSIAIILALLLFEFETVVTDKVCKL